MSFSSHIYSDMQRALCIVDPTLTGAGGHSLAYNLLLAKMATSFELVEIFADRAFRAEKYTNVHAALNLMRLDSLKARLRPILEKIRPARPFQPVPLDFRFVGADPWEPVKVSSYIGKRLRALDLSWSVYRLLSARYAHIKDVHILFQNAGMEELFCLEILRGFLNAGARAVTVHLVFRHAPERTCSRVAGIERLAELLQRLSALPYVCMYTDTEELSAAFKAIVDAPGQFQALPVPSLTQKTGSGSVCRDTRNNKTFRLGMLGPPRMEKGFGCLPALLGVLPARVSGRRLELAAQTDAGEPETRAVTEILQAHATRAELDPDALKLRLLPGPLDSDAYASVFAGLDCALVLHSSPKYAVSSSGIFVEALHLGIPPIVFAGTWMGKLVSRAAAEGLSIGLCVERLGEAPAAVSRIAAEHDAFTGDIAKYIDRHARRFDPKLLAATLFGPPSGMPADTSGAEAC